jgi:hypothetical protein
VLGQERNGETTTIGVKPAPSFYPPIICSRSHPSSSQMTEAFLGKLGIEEEMLWKKLTPIL